MMKRQFVILSAPRFAVSREGDVVTLSKVENGEMVEMVIPEHAVSELCQVLLDVFDDCKVMTGHVGCAAIGCPY